MAREALNFARKMTNERRQEAARSRGVRWPEVKAQTADENLAFFIGLTWSLFHVLIHPLICSDSWVTIIKYGNV